MMEGRGNGFDQSVPIFFPSVKLLEVTVLHKIFAQNYEIFSSVLQIENDSADGDQPIIITICHNHNLLPNTEPQNCQYVGNCPFLSFYGYIHLLLCYWAGI